MRRLPLLACASLVTLLAACAEQERGYYDANGNYVYSYKDTEVLGGNRDREKWPGKPAGYYKDTTGKNYDRRVVRAPGAVVVAEPQYMYQLEGYYNSYGDYIGPTANFTVPSDMWPPRGMCRVWFPNRAPSTQPDVESCDGLINRVPVNAYIVYGG